MWRRSRNLFSFTNTYLSNTDPHNIALFSLLCGASSPGKHGTLSSNYSLDYSNLHCFVFDLHKKSRGFLWQRKSEVIVANQLPAGNTNTLGFWNILNLFASLISLRELCFNLMMSAKKRNMYLYGQFQKKKSKFGKIKQIYDDQVLCIFLLK